MLKVLIWIVSNDGRFFNAALNILQQQHNGLDIVGVTAAQKISFNANGKIVSFIPPAGVTGGGHMIFCS